jgi:hypothetical protein
MGSEAVMFDSPFTYCPKCLEMILLDQTQRECAREHCCGKAECPLQACFCGVDFRSEEAEKGEKECNQPANDASFGAQRSTRR